MLLVLAVALVPLGLAGLWLARGTARSGEELMMRRVSEALDVTVEMVTSNWIGRRGEILSMAESRAVVDAVSRAGDGSPPAGLDSLFRTLLPAVHTLAVYDEDGQERWTLRSTPATGAGSASGRSVALREALSVRYRIPVYRGLEGNPIGTIEAFLGHEALIPVGGLPPQAAGMVLGLFDQVGERSLRPVPFDASLLRGPEFAWAGERWVTARRVLTEPPVTVVVASPASTFTDPFESAARRGGFVLLVVAVLGLAAAWTLARRLTRSLEQLSDAAGAVSAGDFDRRVAEQGPEEVGRLARAFNHMAESLRQTMDQLAAKESLAAVGEFAAGLAHEVRNPLTAIRVDLQSALARLPADAPQGANLQRALREIEHLNATIEESLAHARIGTGRATDVDLWDVLESARVAADPFFQERGATLALDRREATLSPIVAGDPDTLRQVFLNLFRNAAEALGPGGTATVAVTRLDGEVEVAVADTGTGIPEEIQDRVFEPLFTTRSDGTGLGLSIVRRIVEAHGGTVSLGSEAGVGTTVLVRLPIL